MMCPPISVHRHQRLIRRAYARQYGADKFPHLVLLRGGSEVPDTRIAADADDILQRLVRTLSDKVQAADTAAYDQLVAKQEAEDGGPVGDRTRRCCERGWCRTEVGIRC